MLQAEIRRERVYQMILRYYFPLRSRDPWAMAVKKLRPSSSQTLAKRCENLVWPAGKNRKEIEWRFERTHLPTPQADPGHSMQKRP